MIFDLVHSSTDAIRYSTNSITGLCSRKFDSI